MYVYREMLALFAAKAYQSPAQLPEGMEIDLASHLTNTCFQDESRREGSVARFWDLEEATLSPDWREGIFKHICIITGDTFEAATREQTIHFQAVPNAFEIFGLDFLVDAESYVWLLEVNAYPDFKQTGEQLQDVVVGTLFHHVAETAVRPFFASNIREGDQQGSGEMVLVRKIDLGRR